MRRSTLAVNPIITFCNCIVFRPKYQLGRGFPPYNLCEKIKQNEKAKIKSGKHNGHHIHSNTD